MNRPGPSRGRAAFPEVDRPPQARGLGRRRGGPSCDRLPAGSGVPRQGGNPDGRAVRGRPTGGPGTQRNPAGHAPRGPRRLPARRGTGGLCQGVGGPLRVAGPTLASAGGEAVPRPGGRDALRLARRRYRREPPRASRPSFPQAGGFRPPPPPARKPGPRGEGADALLRAASAASRPPDVVAW